MHARQPIDKPRRIALSNVVGDLFGHAQKGHRVIGHVGVLRTKPWETSLPFKQQFRELHACLGHVRCTLRQRLHTTAGLDLKTGDHWNLHFEYTGEFADHFDSNTGSLKATYKF